MNFSKEEKQQYNRHLILSEIGKKGQLKLKQAKVLVIGAGGLGCPVLQYLTAAGVGNIGIVDEDTISQSNLQRQVLFTIYDIGKNKATVAKERLQNLNPFVIFEVFTEYLSKDNAISIIQNYDIVVDATDNFPTRYLINDACVLTKRTLVFGAIFKFEGQVAVFNHEGGATYRCLFPNPPNADEVPNCSEIGVLGVLPGIIGCFQANEVLKIICEIGETLSNKLLTFNALSMSQIILKIKKTEQASISCLADDYKDFCGLNFTEKITKHQYESNKTAYNLLDVRTYEERNTFHIGGQHIPLDELDNRFSEINSEKPLIVYCQSGNRSKQAIQFLQKKITIKLINLKNGII